MNLSRDMKPLTVTVNPVVFSEIFTKELDIKKTWKRNHDLNCSVFAAICCPSCGHSFGVSRRNHRISKEGMVTPLFQCPFVLLKKCDFEKSIQLKGWMPLFAIACERFRKGIMVPEIFYLHAESAREATMEFHNSKYFRDRLVGVSIVVGYNVEDRDGRLLSV